MCVCYGSTVYVIYSELVYPIYFTAGKTAPTSDTVILDDSLFYSVIVILAFSFAHLAFRGRASKGLESPSIPDGLTAYLRTESLQIRTEIDARVERKLPDSLASRQ